MWTPDAIADAILKLWKIGVWGVALVGVLAIFWKWGWPWKPKK